MQIISPFLHTHTHTQRVTYIVLSFDPDRFLSYGDIRGIWGVVSSDAAWGAIGPAAGKEQRLETIPTGWDLIGDTEVTEEVGRLLLLRPMLLVDENGLTACCFCS